MTDANSAGWQQFPALAVLQPRSERGVTELPLLSLSADLGIRRRATEGGRTASEDLSDYRVVRKDDLVINKLIARDGAIAVSSVDGLVSPAYWVFAVNRSLAVPKFLHYLLRSQPYLAEIARRSKFMPPAQFDLPRDQLRRLPLVLPDSDRQRAIADFLDQETASIDSAIRMRQRSSTLLGERTAAIRNEWVKEAFRKYGRIALCRLAVGIEQGWSPACEDAPPGPEEWGVLRTSAVSAGRFCADECKRLPSHMRPGDRWTVRDGDLLVTRGSGSRGSVGRAAVARTDGRKLLFSDLMYRIRLGRGSADYVAEVLESRTLRRKIESAIRTDDGQTLKIRRDDLRCFPIPAVPVANQQVLTDTLRALIAPSRLATDKSCRQTQLLREWRQALITAAVTGEIDVSRGAA